MVELLKKDFRRIMRYVQIPAAFMVFLIYVSPQDVLFSSFLRNMMVLIIGMSAALIMEQNEEKNNGYGFLNSLPIPAEKIVRAKYLLVAGFMLYMVAINAIVVHIFFENPKNIQDAMIILVYFAGFSLVVTGVIIAGMMRWGATKFYTYAFTVIMALAGGAVLILRFMVPETEIIVLLTTLSWNNGLIFMAAAAAFYIFTMFLGERILVKRLGQA